MTIKTISAQDLHRLTSSGQPVELIDVRTPLEFREVHAEYAFNIPLDTLEPAQIMLRRKAPADRPVYIICRSGGRAKQACQKFLTAGFPDVVNVEGGTQAWVEAGLPVVRGKRHLSLERQVRIAAGFLVVAGILLGWLVHPAGLALAGFVGIGLVYAGVTDRCGMGLLLARMPWNRSGTDPSSCACLSKTG